MRLRVLALVALALALLLGWLQHRLWRGNAGANEVATLQAQVTRQARDNAGLKQRNETLAAEVVDLKSGEAAVEERARSELGMIRPGETFYRVVDAAALPEGTPPATPDDGSTPP